MRMKFLCASFILLACCVGTACSTNQAPDGQSTPIRTLPPGPGNDPSEMYRRLKADLFSCDGGPSSPTSSSNEESSHPSVLAHLSQQESDRVTLEPKEAALLEEELTRLLELSRTFILKSSTDDSRLSNHLQGIEELLDKIHSNSTHEQKSLEIEVKPIHDIYRVASTIPLSYDDFGSPYLLKFLLGKNLIDSLSDKDTSFSLSWHSISKTSSKRILPEQLGELISQGFLFKKKAWEIVLNDSPLLRKILQRKIEKLGTRSPTEIEMKQFLSALLVSRSFHADSSDPNVRALQNEFGNEVHVDGLARASVGAVYLVSCSKEGKDRSFVVKASAYKRDELKKKLEEDLANFDNPSQMRMIYPELDFSEANYWHICSNDQKTSYLQSARDKVASLILEEVNFNHEAENLAALKTSYKNAPGVQVVTGIPWTLENESYLLMERAPGHLLNELDHLNERQAASLHTALKSLYEHIWFRKGPYHADTHEGNIFITDDGLVTLIDAGKMNPALDKELTPYLHAAEVGFATLNSLRTNRSGDPEMPLFSSSAAQIVRGRISPIVPLHRGIGPERSFASMWESFFDSSPVASRTYKKGESRSYRHWFIDHLVFTPDLDSVRQSLRAIEVIDRIYHKLLKLHGLAPIQGDQLPVEMLQD